MAGHGCAGGCEFGIRGVGVLNVVFTGVDGGVSIAVLDTNVIDWMYTLIHQACKFM